MMPSTVSRQVAVFWDFENCRPTCSVSGNKVINKIRCLVRDFGSITSFKAYVDLSLESIYSKSISLFSDLQSSGLTLVHCPHNGKKDVADKMMIVDMLAFAMDTSAPATIVIITGDRDFAYAAAILKLRGYHVIVIAPPYNAHSSLKVQADQVYDWQKDVLSGADLEINSSSLKPDGLPASASLPSKTLPSASKTSEASRTEGVPCATPTIAMPQCGSPAHPPGEPEVEAPSIRLHNAVLPPSPSCHRQSFSLGRNGVDSDVDLQEENRNKPGSSSSMSEKKLLSDEPPCSTSLKEEQIQATETIWDSQAAVASGTHSFPSTYFEPLGSSIASTEFETASLISDTDTSPMSSNAPLISNWKQVGASSYDAMSSNSELCERDCPSIFDSSSRQTGLGLDVSIDSRGQDPHSVSLAKEDLKVDSTKVVSDHADVLSRSSVKDERSCSASTETDAASNMSAKISIQDSISPLEPPPSPEKHSPAGVKSSDTAVGIPVPTPAARERFRVLIAFFVERRNSKRPTRITSAEVASEIRKRDPRVYEKAGATKMKSYIEEGRKARVIISPDLDAKGTAWVEINSVLYPADSGSTSQAEKGTYSDLPAMESEPPSRQGPRQAVDALYAPLIDRLRTKPPSQRHSYFALGMFFKEHHPGLYKRACVSSLSAYIDKAEEQGIVQTGCSSSQGREWVRLMPAHRSPAS